MSNCCKNSLNIEKNESDICKACGQAGALVKVITLKSLLIDEAKNRLNNYKYHFCCSPLCTVVYFSNPDSYFYKKDLSVKVSLKENELDIPVCYCFGYTKQDILDEINAVGTSSVEAKIKAKIKANLCACEIKNPQGKCCLASIRAIVESSKM